MKSSSQMVSLGLLCGLGLALMLVPSIAQEADPAAEKRVGDDDAGTLPPGYSVVVKQSQRKQIYAIQSQYAKQIDEIKKQIAALEAKRDAEIRNVLNDEQKRILAYVLKLREDERQEAAKARAATGGDSSE